MTRIAPRKRLSTISRARLRRGSVLHALIVGFVLVLLTPTKVYSLNTAHLDVVPTPPAIAHAPTLYDIAKHIAAEYDVNFDHMWATINCEDPSLDPKQQSTFPDPKGPNGREDSWGLTQINLPSHPNITKAEAEDPVFSFTLMAQNFADGHPTVYHCFKNLHLS